MSLTDRIQAAIWPLPVLWHEFLTTLRWLQSPDRFDVWGDDEEEEEVHAA